MAKTIMLQGTGSDVGKSVLAAALCRIFYQEGYHVAPFKGQNMASNSFVTADGGEIGRAQVVQAEAAKIQPKVQMNPVLLKPTQDASSQVIVLGIPQGNLSARDYHLEYKEKAWRIIKESLYQLAAEYDILVIEGAGSPAEVNLKENDVVNMRVAKEINAPVLLIADIDRGGALASIVGTLELLDPEERALVKGLIINKFRGDLRLLKPALDFLEEKTAKPVLGVIPYFHDLNIPEEDSLVLDHQHNKKLSAQILDIAVVRFQHLANFTDFDALNSEIDVQIRYIQGQDDFGSPDLLILPGSKNILSDLNFLETSGLAALIKKAASSGTPIIGISGGFQVLGQEIIISHLNQVYQGLNLLKIKTIIDHQKTTVRVKGNILQNTGLFKGCRDMLLEGYEIHLGSTDYLDEAEAFLFVNSNNQAQLEGSCNQSGWICGTHLHGIFDNDDFRRKFLNNLREKSGLEPIFEPTANLSIAREEAFEKLAQIVRNNLDLPLLYQVMGLENE